MQAFQNHKPTLTLGGFVPQGLWGLLLVSACCMGLPGTSHASQSAAAYDPESTAAKPTASRTYQPKPQETLDKVIEHTMAGSPLKIELLRQAFMTQNPQAFIPGKVPKLRKRVTLTVPDHDELLRIHLGARVAPGVDPLQPARFTPSTAEERKRWVQFP